MRGYLYMSHGEPLVNEKGEIHLARKNECEDVSTKNGIFECSECGCQITPYFADGEKYPNLIGVRAEGDEYETAYVRKSDMAEAVDYWRRMYEGAFHMSTGRPKASDIEGQLWKQMIEEAER